MEAIQRLKEAIAELKAANDEALAERREIVRGGMLSFYLQHHVELPGENAARIREEVLRPAERAFAQLETLWAEFEERARQRRQRQAAAQGMTITPDDNAPIQRRPATVRQ